MNNRHPWQLKKSKSWGPFWSYQLNSTANICQFSLFTSKMGQMGCIGSAVQLVTPKGPPEFQLPWLPIIHFSLFPLRPMPPNIMDIINCSQAVCMCMICKTLVTLVKTLSSELRTSHPYLLIIEEKKLSQFSCANPLLSLSYLKSIPSNILKFC